VKVTLISLSDISRDWRVRRHAQLLSDNGFEARTVGLRAEAPLPWPAADIELPGWSTREKAEQALRLLSVRIRPGSAEGVYWSSPRYQALYAAAAGTGYADLFVANDWNTLPVAARLAREHGSRYAYDTHEYAVEEGADRARWRLVWPPFLRALEGDLIPGATWVSTVSEGIADLLQADNRLEQRPTVIRNVPAYKPMPYRPPGEPLTVLFHGGLLRDRGLEPLIESVRDWRPDRRLVIRGKGDPDYVRQLRSIVERSGTAQRVSFQDAVPLSEVVAAANETADIGIHAMPAVTNQTRFALPNKLFEYTMAGLAVAVVKGSEMARVVTEHGNGVLLPECRSGAIAATVNALSVEQVAELKHASLAAALDLSWESEQRRLTSLYERV
jgi:glycosyltransferase involved in cell wall biosynthesis